MNNQYLPLYRQIYRKYLQRYSCFRIVKKIILALRWNSYPLILKWYYLVSRRILSKSYRLIDLNQYITKYHGEKIRLISSKDFLLEAPKFSNHDLLAGEKFSAIKVHSPAIDVFLIKNVIIMGGTNFVFKENFAIHPEEYVPEIEVCPAETAKVAAVHDDYSSITFPLFLKVREFKELSASLLSQCPGNYAHWLTEVLPKLAVLESLVEYQHIPLLVDGWIHPNFLESLDVLCANKRELIKVGRWEKVLAKNLLGVSTTAYIPAESRQAVESKKAINDGAMNFSFSKFSINLMKEKILQKIPSLNSPLEKLFIRRESTYNGRNAINADELEIIALEFGYTIIEPGKMSFTEQVALFRDAKVVAGQIGAALTNAIFSEKCKLVVLSPYYENANYNFFSNLLGMLEHDLTYVVGPQVEDNRHHLHRNYFINPLDFRKALMEVVC